tara:strand:+ start:1 stop:2715 length:2715 start_codon:yes stop_codon:yes gene_type:complete
MKKITLLFLTMFSFTFTFSQSNLKGRVLDSNGFPLPGATLIVEGDKGTVTDFNGFYRFVNLDSGSVEIKVSYIGFEGATTSVELTDNSTTTKDFTLEPSATELAEIVVSGYSSGIVKGLNQQKSDLNVTNIISADQVGKFPDDNVGDVLKRVAGVSMQGDQGEARNIVIRGFAAGLNSVTLNGDRIPSAEGNNRNVQLDLIPSAMIQTIEVNKSMTPDMEGDAIGGSVNLVTRSNPSTFRASATLSAGDEPIRSDGSNSNFAFVIADKMNDKLSYSFSTSVQTRNYGSDNIEFEWNNPDDWAEEGAIGEHDIRRYDVKRKRRSVGLNLDYEIDDNNSLFIKTIYNHRDDWENRFRLRVSKIDDWYADPSEGVRVRKQTKGGINNDINDNTRLEDQRLKKISFGGDHLFGKINMDWKVSTSKASEERPNERYVRFQNSSADLSSIDLSDPEYPVFNFEGGSWNDPSEYNFSHFEDAQKYTQEENSSIAVNFEMPYNDGDDSFKFGVKYKAKEKMRNDYWAEYEDDFPYETMADADYFNATIDGYDAGDAYQLGNFATAQWLGSQSLTNGAVLLDEFAGGNYSADEKITAAYAMVTDKLGDKTTLVFGARFEKTDIDYIGNIYDEDTDESVEDLEEVSGDSSYGNILPSLNIQHEFSDKLIANFAYSNSIARPNYYDLVPYQVLVSEDLEIEVGNPDLEASLSNNVDFMIDYYFGGITLVSGGVFFKSIDNWLYEFADNDYEYNGVSGWDYRQLRNGSKAKVTGLELGFQTKLLDNFTLMANYTYTDSSTEGVEDRDDVPLVGAIENMYNASLAYENKKFFVRASMNYAGEALDQVGGDPWEDRYYDEQLFVDLNATYKFSDKLSIFAEAKNLTNQPLRYYQGVKERTMQLEYYSYNWNVGLKYDF